MNLRKAFPGQVAGPAELDHRAMIPVIGAALEKISSEEPMAAKQQILLA